MAKPLCLAMGGMMLLGPQSPMPELPFQARSASSSHSSPVETSTSLRGLSRRDSRKYWGSL
jgi:hypothetical protein